MSRRKRPGLRATSTAAVPDPVISAATHALVIVGEPLVNNGPAARFFRDGEESPPIEDADLVCQAIQVVTHHDTGYAQVLRRPLGWADRWRCDLPAVSVVTTLRRYPDRFDDDAWHVSPSPIEREELDELPDVVSALRSAPKNVRLAAPRFSTAQAR